MVDRPEALHLEVPAQARGQRLDQFLAAGIPSLSRSRLGALISGGAVAVDGAKAKASRRLKGGERVAVTVPEPVAAIPRPEELPLRILFEDRDLVVLDKAAGMVVHPAAGNWTGTLVNALLHRVKDLSGVGGELRPGLVHRLDKDTSGVMVVAKNEPALKGLQASFKSREVEKLYLALVLGAPPPRGTFRTLHGRHPRQRKKFTGKVKEGKPAVTHFEVRERLSGAALVEATLETGRTHQIRVHFAEAGFPLVGDLLYGKKSTLIGRQALHAWRLKFPHPRSGKSVAFEAPPPPDFEAARAALAVEV